LNTNIKFDNYNKVMNKETIKAQWPDVYDQIFQLGVQTCKLQFEQATSMGHNLSNVGFTSGMADIMAQASPVSSSGKFATVAEFMASVDTILSESNQKGN
jgi:hypothetical protein